MSHEKVSGNIEIQGKQNSLFPKGPVIFICYIAKQVGQSGRKTYQDSRDNIRPPLTAHSDQVQLLQQSTVARLTS